MHLQFIDWAVVILFFILSLVIGLISYRKSGSSSSEYFLSGRSMSWWLLGISMVATTFSADTPNLVTDIIRKNGVAGNWVWWAFCLTGMLTVFVYAKLWRRSGIMTDLEFYELRYSGKEAKYLRAFRALYLGIFFNVVIMASVMLAGVKISSVLLGLSAFQTVTVVSLITLVYSYFGGFRGIILTDFFQFIIAMTGMVLACIYIVNMPQIGGLNALLTHPNVVGKLNFLPDFNDTNVLIPVFIIPIAVQWWSVWYPGAEPGGGGYVVQRMLSAKDEKNAVDATFLFNVAHYALRPWPWILIALASMIIFPNLSDIAKQFPEVDPKIINDDLAFPAMMTFLPTGLLGIIIAALAAALMSTISTHLNWGSSYIVNDFYGRFINKEASEKELVNVGRLTTVILMILAAVFAMFLQNALQAFDILLQIGAGTGLLFILRWFWWRINATCEIVAMIVSFIIALIMQFVVKDALLSHEKLLIGVSITTVAWLITAFVTKPTDKNTLYSFFNLIKPHKLGWEPVIKEGQLEGKIEKQDNVQNGKLITEITMMILGCFIVYSSLFGFGYLIYGNYFSTLICLVVLVLSIVGIRKQWKNITFL